jgi:transcriptional regulator with XRE-family HTH domain
MVTNPTAVTLRAKIFGTLIRDARLAADKQIKECAIAIGVSGETFEAYELGKKPISLPELEGIAYYLDIPIEHFWGNQTLVSENGHKKSVDMEKLIQLRHRMVGAQLRQARLEAKLSLDDLAQKTQLDPALLEAYELAKEAVPLPELEILCGILNRSIREFQDQYGPVGLWNAQQRALQDFVDLPLDLQVFVSKPINRPYIELAIRLSEMSVERLRSVAEGLLEITY